MGQWEWNIQRFRDEEAAIKAQEKYAKDGYKVSDIYIAHEVDEKSGATVPVYVLQITYEPKR